MRACVVRECKEWKGVGGAVGVGGGVVMVEEGKLALSAVIVGRVAMGADGSGCCWVAKVGVGGWVAG